MVACATPIVTKEMAPADPSTPARTAEPTSAPEPAAPGSFFDLLTRDGPPFDLHVVDPARHDTTIRKLLGVIVAASVLYGGAVGLVAQLSDLPIGLAGWFGSVPVVTLPVAFTAAFLLAIAVCLPSFYFYTQLSGLDATFRIVTAQALRAQARTSVLMLGALPVYIAIALAAVVGVIQGGASIVLFGLLMPFVLGLSGLVSLFKSFGRLSESLPVAHKRRPRFVPRLVLAWGAVYTAVCPVALYRIGQALGGLS